MYHSGFGIVVYSQSERNMNSQYETDLDLSPSQLASSFGDQNRTISLAVIKFQTTNTNTNTKSNIKTGIHT